jgi:hypothetical protein
MERNYRQGGVEKLTCPLLGNQALQAELFELQGREIHALAETANGLVEVANGLQSGIQSLMKSHEIVGRMLAATAELAALS